MHSADFLTAVAFVVSFFLMFDVAFPKQTKTVALLLATSAFKCTFSCVER